MIKITGKALLGRYIILSLGKSNENFLIEFDTDIFTERYYHSIEIGKDRLSLARSVKYKLCKCKKENIYDLEIGSDICYYQVCTKCNRASYISKESKEDIDKRISRHTKLVKLKQIEDMKAIINEMQEDVDMLELEYKKEYGDE